MTKFCFVSYWQRQRLTFKDLILSSFALEPIHSLTVWDDSLSMKYFTVYEIFHFLWNPSVLIDATVKEGCLNLHPLMVRVGGEGRFLAQGWKEERWEAKRMMGDEENDAGRKRMMQGGSRRWEQQPHEKWCSGSGLSISFYIFPSFPMFFFPIFQFFLSVNKSTGTNTHWNFHSLTEWSFFWHCS